MEAVEDVKGFGTADFIVLGVMLLLAVVIGIYYAITDRKSNDMETYNFGGRKMSPIPLGLSISVTFVSAITFIAYPVETYLFGSVLLWFSVAGFIPAVVMSVYYIPLMHRLQVSSIYEYLELRFDSRMRKLGSILACMIMIFFMSMTVYVPGLALSAVTPLGLTTTILITSLICTFYTCLGGMKAVVWTDTIQSLIMFAGSLAVFIKCIILVGGFGNAWDIAERGGRLNFFNFDPNPTIRNTFWTIIVGCGVGWSSPNQAVIQRYLSCDSVSKARKAAFFTLIPNFVFLGIAVASGLSMYAYYETCDPLTSKKIEKPDQLMPYLVLEIFQDLPGMAGLFVASGFSGTLSTVSSGINSLAALIMEDFVIPKRPKMSQAGRVTISRLIVVGFGVIVMSFALTVEHINGTVMQIGYTTFGTIGGGLAGVFTLGMFFPWVTTKGAFVGQVVGTVITGWVAISSLLYGKSPANQALSLSTESCSGITLLNSTESTTMSYWKNETYTTTTIVEESEILSTTLFAVSYLYFPLIGMIFTISSGVIVSFATGATKSSECDPELFVPLISNSIFPPKVIDFFRFGVPERYSEKGNSDQSFEKEWMIEYNDAQILSKKYDDMIESNV